MLFQSRVAENANRRSRLIFDTPDPVLPPTSEAESAAGDSKPDVQRMPSWVEKRENPFAVDNSIPPLSTQSSSLGSVTSPTSVVDRNESASTSQSDDSSPNSAESHVSPSSESHSTPEGDATTPSGFESHASERERLAGSANRADTRSLPRQDHYPCVSGKPAIFPVPAMLLAGMGGRPMLSTLANGVLVNRIPHGISEDGRTLTVAVALPAKTDVEPKTNYAEKRQGFFGLSHVDVPLSPFDPFGEVRIAREDKLALLPGEGSWARKKNEFRSSFGSLLDERTAGIRFADDEGLDGHSELAEAGSGDEAAPIKGVVAMRGDSTTFLAPPVITFPEIQRFDSEGVTGGVPVNTPVSYTSTGPPALPLASSKHQSFLVSRPQQGPINLGRRNLSANGVDRSHAINILDHSLLPTGVHIPKGKEHYPTAPFSVSSTQPNDGTTVAQQQQGPINLGRRSLSENGADRSQAINILDHSLLPTGVHIPKGKEHYPTAPFTVSSTQPNDATTVAQQQQQEPTPRKSLRKSMMAKIRKLRQPKKQAAN